MKQNQSVDPSRLHTRASRELVLRFGLNKGLSSGAKSIDTHSSKSLREEDAPELDDILLQLENPSSPATTKFVSILVGLSQLASKYKNGAEVSVDDLDQIIEAFAADFADGSFDGKGSDGKPITIGSGASQITFSGDPLATVLLPAIISFVQEGGTLSVGIPTKTPPPILLPSEISSQIQFAGNTPIASSDFGTSSASFTYPSSTYNFTLGQSISPINPVVSGASFNSCSANPTLPTGLTISNDCVITGTPQSASIQSHTITASFSSGTISSTITINVIDPNAPPTAFSYSVTNATLLQNQAISALSPNILGIVNSYSVSPSLPTGLNLNTTTGVISGTPTSVQGSITYTITATNTFGSTTTSIQFAVLIPPPSNLSYPSSNFSFYKSSTITNQSPSVTGTVTSYTVSPSLPVGLSLNATTGVLSGIPTTLQSSSPYTITATNSTGTASTTIQISVVIPPPSGLSYPSSEYQLKQGSSICATSILPTVTGDSISFSISPILPEGLSLNTSTGEITGSPSAAYSTTAYSPTLHTVTATNSTGSTTTTITLSVESIFQFSNAGQTGRTGPTQAQVNTAYSCTSLKSAVTINTQGIQEWSVPSNGTYRMEVVGAQGGSNSAAGGKGARMIGDFSLTSGTVLNILVGQSGNGSGSGNRGGGGGSFVWRKSDNTLLIAAGGGGGAGGSGSAGMDAVTGTSGTTLRDGSGTPGTAGSGATNGAGWLTNGGSISSGSAAIKASGGGVGGAGYAGNEATHFGGFGGGGGGGGAPSTTNNAGGGGGYSGGAGDEGAGGIGGGGGGSYNSGTNQSNTSAYQLGHGFVKITKL